MSFIDEFKDIVPYNVNVTVGKNKQFINDPSKINRFNHKGKMVDFYKKATTIEEFTKHGIGSYRVYLPAEEVSLPIDVSITCPEGISIKEEKTSKYTYKKNTSHQFRLFDEDNNQVGYISITITPAGDINNKYCSYENRDLTHELSCYICNYGDSNQEEHFTFEKYDKDGSKSLEIVQKNGKIIGVAVTEREATIKENIEFPKIRQSINYINSRVIKHYVASCVVDEVDMDKRGGALIPSECKILEEDLLRYQRAMNQFQQNVGDFKEKTGIDVSIEKAIEIGKLSYDKREQEGLRLLKK